MICSTSSPPIRRRPGEGRGPRGFTLVELLAVILILSVLIALLLPAINGAVRTAKNAAVGAEINQLAQALASFKAKYGDYPPSRVWLSEDGNFGVSTSTAALATGDISTVQLAQRSLAIMRKFFPQVVFNSSSDVFGSGSAQWYDFNGDGLFQYHAPYILQGHECLVFFLGGIPQQTASGFGMTGFGKDPTNPFKNAAATSNRQAPFFEFVGNRLVVDPSRVDPVANPTAFNRQVYIPGYLDSLGNPAPVNAGDPINFYAFFSSYGNNGYDPNDVNFVADNYDPVSTTSPELQYYVTFPIPPLATTNPSISYGPNPYTTSYTIGGTGTTTFFNPQTFQIISSGSDGTYGVGGQYAPDNTTGVLPLDTVNNPYVNNWIGPGLRKGENDNVTNFHSGRLN